MGKMLHLNPKARTESLILVEVEPSRQDFLKNLSDCSVITCMHDGIIDAKADQTIAMLKKAGIKFRDLELKVFQTLFDGVMSDILKSDLKVHLGPNSGIWPNGPLLVAF